MADCLSGPGESAERWYSAELAEILLSEETLSSVLERTVGLAADSIPKLVGASVSVLRNNRPSKRFETVNASSETVRAADEAQYQLGDGPCVEAMLTGRECRAVVADRRWQEFSRQAGTIGVRAVWSLPLIVLDRTIGALNLYSAELQPWDDPSRELAGALSRHAAIVVANAAALHAANRVNEDLVQALDRRDLIGQAKGILMARQHIDADTAFGILRRASQRENRKLVEIARRLVDGVLERTTDDSLVGGEGSGEPGP